MFLFFFTPKTELKKAFLGISLKKGVQILTILTFAFLGLYMFIDLIFTNFDGFAIIKDSILVVFNIIAGALLLMSTFSLNLKNSRRGYFVLCFTFCFHILIVFGNALFIAFGYRIYNFVKPSGLLFFTLLTVYEFYYLWIVYNYTNQLERGNDALVDGFNFNRYVENFGSADNSFRSSVSMKS
jgi:hypothetical protein